MHKTKKPRANDSLGAVTLRFYLVPSALCLVPSSYFLSAISAACAAATRAMGTRKGEQLT
jgi:hypothetical protein